MTDQQIFTFVASTAAQSVASNGTTPTTLPTGSVSTMRNETYDSLQVGDRVFVYGGGNEGKARVKQKNTNGTITFRYDSGREETLNSFVNVFQFSTLDDELRRRGGQIS